MTTTTNTTFFVHRETGFSHNFHMWTPHTNAYSGPKPCYFPKPQHPGVVRRVHQNDSQTEVHKKPHTWDTALLHTPELPITVQSHIVGG